MLVSNGKPSEALAARLTKVFGTDTWEEAFYGSVSYRSVLEDGKKVEVVYKDADKFKITQFFVDRLKGMVEGRCPLAWRGAAWSSSGVGLAQIARVSNGDA